MAQGGASAFGASKVRLGPFPALIQHQDLVTFFW